MNGIFRVNNRWLDEYANSLLRQYLQKTMEQIDISKKGVVYRYWTYYMNSAEVIMWNDSSIIKD